MKVLKDHPCDQCGTTRYRETHEGEMVCKYGHLLTGWREETGDEMAWVGRARARRSKLRTVDTETEVLKGNEREAAQMRIVQYGLQMVSRSFVHDLQFPADFEYVVRELWLVHIAPSGKLLPNRFTSQYADLPARAQSQWPDQIASAPVASLEEEFDLDVEQPDRGGSSIDESSSSSSSSDNGDDDTTRKIDKPKQRRARMNWPHLQYYHIIVFCYLACVWMRIPVLPNDIYRWCFNYTLPYLKVVRDLPADLVKRLDNRAIELFTRVPTMRKIEMRIRAYKRAFAHHCGLRFPKANVPLLMHRFCNQFFLPDSLYFGAKRIYERLDARYEHMADPRKRPSDEILAMVCTLMLVKLCYRLDDNALNPVFEQQGMPPLLSKDAWNQRIQENLARWNRMQRQEISQSEDTELPVTLELLRDLGEFARKKTHRVQGNALRQHMRAWVDESGKREWSTSDLYVKPPQHTASSESPASGVGTSAVGSKYITYKQDFEHNVFYKEYDRAITLASFILGTDYSNMHSWLQQSEFQFYHAINKA